MDKSKALDSAYIRDNVYSHSQNSPFSGLPRKKSVFLTEIINS